MGILNVTPDSFFDGGSYVDPERQAVQIDRLIAEGAELIDIGGESSRPGSQSVGAREQIARIDGALRHALAKKALVSVDTIDPEVAAHALKLGAQLLNDISCLADLELARVAARHGAALIITHNRGPMSEMPGFSQWPDSGYDDIVGDIVEDWEKARKLAESVGVARENILFDPGLGFSKNARHCYVILQRLRELERLGSAIVVGPGRKSFIADVDPSKPEERLGGTIAASLLAVEHGADILRVHDVAAVRQALLVASAIHHPPPPRETSRV
jgi:dihydropteroate synthase